MLKKGCLYIVATPIGNLRDITLRAIEVLKSVELIAAEDTRHSQRLLQNYQITTPAVSFHQFNEEKRFLEFEARLEKGQDIAVISDAGTPLISDPGYRLVNYLAGKGFKIIPIPGPCAAIAAISVSGLATDRFAFEGFMPVKKGERLRYLQELENHSATLIFYEAPHRILSLLDSMIEAFGSDRPAVVARELTKTFETLLHGTLQELKQKINEDSHQQLGEFVVLVQGQKKQPQQEIMDEYHRILKILLLELPLKQAVDIAVKLTKGPRKILYRLALNLKGV